MRGSEYRRNNYSWERMFCAVSALALTTLLILAFIGMIVDARTP